MPQGSGVHAVVVSLLAFGTACWTSHDGGGDGYDGGDRCVGDCVSVGQTRCNGNVVELCTVAVEQPRCLRWVERDDCAATGMWCGEGPDGSACRCGECPAAGESRCDGVVLQACSETDDGCLRWNVDETCSVGEFACHHASEGRDESCMACNEGTLDGDFTITDICPGTPSHPEPCEPSGDLLELEGFNHVAGSLELYEWIAEAPGSLAGLECLQQIDDTLVIGSCPELRSLSGLDGLTSIGGDLAIVMLPGLTNLDGLAALTELGGDLQITDNPVLPTCEATALETRLRDAGWQGEATIEGNDDAGVCE